MSAISRLQWSRLQRAIADLDENAPPRILLEVLLEWLRGNSDLIGVWPFSLYGIDRFVEINESEMPSDYSAIRGGDISHVKKTISKLESKDVLDIARFLRDLLEELAVFESEKNCPNCESGGMMVYVGRENNLLAYVCKQCGRCQYEDGTLVKPNELKFADVDVLRRKGLI